MAAALLEHQALLRSIFGGKESTARPRRVAKDARGKPIKLTPALFDKFVAPPNKAARRRPN